MTALKRPILDAGNGRVCLSRALVRRHPEGKFVLIWLGLVVSYRFQNRDCAASAPTTCTAVAHFVVLCELIDLIQRLDRLFHGMRLIDFRILSFCWRDS